MRAVGGGVGLVALLAAACTVSRSQPNLVGQDVRVTVIHTSDIHSRLFPYNFTPLAIDRDFGLEPGQGPYGGIARMGAIVKAERQKVRRSLWLDSGDCFQGAPVFNVFKGEAEFRALSQLGLDAAVVGNHEFDLGAQNFYDQIVNNAAFPLLAANYYFEDPAEPNRPKLREVVQPYQIFDLDGITVGVIGMANWSSLTGIFEGQNSLGIRPLADADTVKDYVALLRPSVDLVVLLSHLGLDEDEGLAASEVQDQNEGLPLDGVDLILGGHLHIVLNPPKIANVDAYGHQTVLVHSGAFAKYVGRLDLVVRKGEDNADPARRSHIAAFSYQNLPVACGARTRADQACPNPSDAETVALLQPYSVLLNQILDLDGVFAYVSVGNAGKVIRNDPSGGDSQLGNLVARAMQRRQGVDADFAITNSLGIRADFEPGPLTLEQMYNVFPFENSITIMFLSGVEVQDTLDFVARKSSERGCRTQAQVAGISFKMVCGQDAHAAEIYLGEGCRDAGGNLVDPAASGCVPLVPQGLYRVAVNDYIAAGGSGFTVLKRNTSKQNTGISLRDALISYIRAEKNCPVDLIDPSDPMARPVVDVYGPITCIDGTIERHDNRISPSIQ
jgi:2',3'-cyclic-nucleotide 2'-phosphodiesterase (5'-nucleotidase family)